MRIIESPVAEALERGFVAGRSFFSHRPSGDNRDWHIGGSHVLADDAKSEIAVSYSKGPAPAYFAECSTGGQHTLSDPQESERIIASGL